MILIARHAGPWPNTSRGCYNQKKVQSLMSSISVTSDLTRQLPDDSSPYRDEICRANLYQLLARAFSSPLEMTKKHPEALAELVPELPTTLQQESRELARIWDIALTDREALSLALSVRGVSKWHGVTHGREPSRRRATR